MRRTSAFVSIAFLAGLGVGFPTPQNFQWNWHEGQELYAQESLRSAKIANHDRQAIAAAIAGQLRKVRRVHVRITRPGYRLRAPHSARDQNDIRPALADLTGNGHRERQRRGQECAPADQTQVFSRGTPCSHNSQEFASLK